MPSFPCEVLALLAANPGWSLRCDILPDGEIVWRLQDVVRKLEVPANTLETLLVLAELSGGLVMPPVGAVPPA